MKTQINITMDIAYILYPNQEHHYKITTKNNTDPKFNYKLPYLIEHIPNYLKNLNQIETDIIEIITHCLNPP